MAGPSDGVSLVDDLIVRAARLLNDYDEQGGQHVRWVKPSLLDYLNEALAQISAHRRDAFTSQEVLQLSPGAQQRLPAEFIELVKLDRNVVRAFDDSLVYGSQIAEQDQRLASVFRKKPCLTQAAPYEVRSFARNTTNTATFDVSPPVPAGERPEVVATVVKRPPLFGVGNYKAPVGIKPEFKAALIEWMLYRAFSVDTESSAMAEAAARHERSFYNILGIQKKNRAEFNMDYRANLPIPASPVARFRPRSDTP